MKTITDIPPKCPYCKNQLNVLRHPDDKVRWCVHCLMWMNADGTKMKEEREWLRDAKDLD